MQIDKVSVVIATYNMAHLIGHTVRSILSQTYDNKEIIIYDDCSKDGTFDIYKNLTYLKYYRGEKNVGVGEAFNRGIAVAQGEIVILMCADDLFTNDLVISDIVERFKTNRKIGHISRWYHQFIDGDRRPVRAWRSGNPILQANNPSGLAFRKSALKRAKCSSKMFVETTALVSEVLKEGWAWGMIKYDTIAARVHKSTSTTPGYWLKHRVSSPVLDQVSLGAKEISTDYSSLIQIKNGFKISAVLEEIVNFIKVRPLNLINPMFWFFSMVSILTPRAVLRKIPDIYRRTVGRWTTKEVKRPF